MNYSSAILVFTDGASSGNPGPGGWGVIISSPDGKVLEMGGGEAKVTNNQMELMGAIQALRRIGKTPHEIHVFTDSTYVIRGITQWIWGWRKRGWISAEGKPVANEELWKTLANCTAQNQVHWHYVKGHSGIPGNERTDEIAVAFSQKKYVSLYQGPLLGYPIPIHDLPENSELPEMKPREKSAPAYSYLSLVNNVPMRHSSWAECEARVKGRSGARFKKALTAEEEKAILKSWGFEDLP